MQRLLAVVPANSTHGDCHHPFAGIKRAPQAACQEERVCAEKPDPRPSEVAARR